MSPDSFDQLISKPAKLFKVMLVDRPDFDNTNLVVDGKSYPLQRNAKLYFVAMGLEPTDFDSWEDEDLNQSVMRKLAQTVINSHGVTHVVDEENSMVFLPVRQWLNETYSS
jgi:hypothetical protein